MGLEWIGYSSSTIDGAQTPSDQIRYVYASSQGAGTLSSFNIQAGMGWSPTEYGRGAVYLSSNRSLVAQTGVIPGVGATSWLTADFGPSSINANTWYIVAFWGGDGTQILDYDQVGLHHWWDGGKDFEESGNGDFSSYFSTLNSESDYTKESDTVLHMYAVYNENPTATITNISGCVASGVSTVTLSAKCTGGPGNVKFYYETGSTGGGTDPSEWRYSSQYEDTVTSGEYITKQITGLSPGTGYCYRAYISSNNLGGGDDWFDSTITFGTSEGHRWDEGDSLRIYYSCNQYPANYVDCWASRWDESNYDVIIEAWMGSGARNALFHNLKPGAVRELYKVLGKPTFIDSTYSSGNTLILQPLASYGLSSLREKRTVAVKNISDTFVTRDKFNVKLECKRIDT